MTLQPLWPLLAVAMVLLAATLLWVARTWPTQPHAGARIAMVARVLLAVVAVGIGLRPMATAQVAVPQEKRVDVLVMLDRTTSMAAPDGAGGRTRMDGAAADLTALLDDLAGAQVAVQVFDDDARLGVPFTTDATAVTTFLQTVGWRPAAKADGSDISVGVDHAVQILEQAAASRPDHQRYLVYAGDGEQTVDTPPASFARLAPFLSGALVLGYGTSDGAPMATSPGSDNLVQHGGEAARSRFDEASLRQIADEVGGTFHHRTAAAEVPTLVEPDADQATTALRPSEDYAWALGLVASPLLIVLLWHTVSGARAAREELT